MKACISISGKLLCLWNTKKNRASSWRTKIKFVCEWTIYEPSSPSTKELHGQPISLSLSNKSAWNQLNKVPCVVFQMAFFQFISGDAQGLPTIRTLTGILVVYFTLHLVGDFKAKKEGRWFLHVGSRGTRKVNVGSMILVLFDDLLGKVGITVFLTKIF